MSKRLLILSTSLVLSLLALLLGGAPLVAATSVAVTIDAAAEAVENTAFTASVNIANLTAFDAGQFDISINDSTLRLDDVTGGVIGTTQIPVTSWNKVGTGKYRVIVNVPGVPGVSGSGSLAVLHFYAIGAAGTSSAINLSNGFLNNNLGSEISATWTGDSVSLCKSLSVSTSSLSNGTIGSTYSATLGATGGNGNFSWSLLSGSLPGGFALSPAGVISGVTTSVGDFAFTVRVTDGQLTASKTLSITVTPRTGDANGDGLVNTSDITKVERIILEIDGLTAAADVNQDGRINTADLTRIERIIAGLA